MTEEENIIQIARTRQDELYNGIRKEWLSHRRKMDNFLNELESIQIHLEDLQRENMKDILRKRWIETHEG
jgi:hypothetical protein